MRSSAPDRPAEGESITRAVEHRELLAPGRQTAYQSDVTDVTDERMKRKNDGADVQRKRGAQEREEQMVTSSFTSSAETQVPGGCTPAEEALLSEAERASLQLFVARLGDRIADDNSLFSGPERHRLLFLRWLNMHGQLPS